DGTQFSAVRRDALQASRNRRFFGGIQLHGPRVAALFQRVGGRSTLLLASRAYVHCATGFDESFGNRAPELSGAADDERRLTLHREEVFDMHCCPSSTIFDR